MSKITISNMSYHYTQFYHPIFDKVNLTLDTNWKLGLIGRNGRGKTTLLRLLLGTLEPDKGRIHIPVIPEYFPYANQSSYLNTMDVIKENIGNLKSIEDTMEEIISSDDQNRLTEYNILLEAYLNADGYAMESRILKEFEFMHLSHDILERDFDTLSEGEKTKILMIALFLRPNTFALLDEPTNHLDLEGKAQVTDYLKRKRGFIVVSHDRTFLDQVIDHVISINKADIAVEQGNYSSWKHNKDLRDDFELRTKEKLEHEIRHLELLSDKSRKWASVASTQKATTTALSHARANGEKAYMRQAKRSEEQIQRDLEAKKKLLLNYEKVEDLTIAQETKNEGLLLRAHELTFGYTPSRTILKEISLSLHTGEKVWIQGKNGTGKSTLLHLLAQDIPNTLVEYMDELSIAKTYQEPLWKKGYLLDYFKDDKGYLLESPWNKFLDFCEIFELPGDFLDRPLESYSSGELKKTDIARALTEDNHVLLMDEPLNYMDTYFREQLETAIRKANPTMVFIEHDENFSRRIATGALKLG